MTSQEFPVKDSNTKLIFGSIIATLIAITPYLFYFYENVPERMVWETFLFKYTSYGWQNANIAWWVYVGKIIPLFLLFIWFSTCRHWWYHALLVPISMYIFQLIMVVNDDSPFIDRFQLIYLIPIMALIIPSIYVVRLKLLNTLNTVKKTDQELEDEIKITPKRFWLKIINFF